MKNFDNTELEIQLAKEEDYINKVNSYAKLVLKVVPILLFLIVLLNL